MFLGAFSDAWQAQYYNNGDLQGTPSVEREEETIAFDWGLSSPELGAINPDGFSARFTRSVTLLPGQYRFDLTVDDGARLWVNSELLIDAW